MENEKMYYYYSKERIIGFQNITGSCITGNDIIGRQLTGSDVGHVTGSDVTGSDIIFPALFPYHSSSTE
jgi:hypothetical protein